MAASSGPPDSGRSSTSVRPPNDAADTTPTARARGFRRWPFWLLVVLAGLLLAILVRTFLVQVFLVGSDSMEPTLVRGDRVLVDETAYWFGEPEPGDVIVFEAPDQQDLVKRVIAIGGQTWEIRGGVVYVDGRRLGESYVSRTPDDRSFGPESVPDERLFVLGDNRSESQDSRFSAVGYVPEGAVVGRAVAVVWPPSELRWL